MSTVLLRAKIWLEKDGDKVFGDGPFDLLSRISRLGSLCRATEEVNMSYAQGWKLIRRLEARLGFRLVQSRAGGKGGGGTILTERGEWLMERWRRFRVRCQELMLESYREHFGSEMGLCVMGPFGQRSRPRPS